MILNLDLRRINIDILTPDLDGVYRNACNSLGETATCNVTLGYTIDDVNTVVHNNVELTGQFQVNIPVPIYKSVIVNLSVKEVSGEYSDYNNVFTLFNYDIGDFDTNTFNTTSFLPIYLITLDSRTINQKDPLSLEYIPYIQKLAYTSFLAVREPLSNNLYLYKTNSSEGVTEYFNLTKSLGIVDNLILCCPNDVLISQSSKTHYIIQDNCCGSSKGLFSECFSNDYLISQFNLLPEIITQYKTKCNCEDTCVSTFTNPKVIHTVNLSNIDCLLIDGVITTFIPFLDSLQLDTKIFGVGSTIENNEIKGLEILTNSIDVLLDIVTTSCPLYFTNESQIHQYEIPFIVPKEGDYIIKTEYAGIINETPPIDLFRCVKSDTFYGCEWFSLERIECAKIRLKNKSLTNATGYIFKLVNNVFVLQNTYLISACSFVDVDLKDGVYKFVGNNSNTTEDIVYPEVITCQVQKCWYDKNVALLCCSDKPTCNEKDVYLYNSMSAQTMFLFTLLNEVGNFGNTGWNLNEEDLKTLYNIDSIINRILSEYCDECSSSTPCNSSINSSTGCQSCK